MRQIDQVIGEIQQAQLDAGGRFLSPLYIKDMRVEDLLQLLLPNNVKFDVKFIPKGIKTAYDGLIKPE